MGEAAAQAQELDFSQDQRVKGESQEQGPQDLYLIPGGLDPSWGQKTRLEVSTAILGRDSGGLSYDGGPEWRSVESPEILWR